MSIPVCNAIVAGILLLLIIITDFFLILLFVQSPLIRLVAGRWWFLCGLVSRLVNRPVNDDRPACQSYVQFGLAWEGETDTGWRRSPF